MLQAPDDELQTEVQQLEVTNVSSLPLTAQMALPEPFALLQPDGSTCNEQVLLLHGQLTKSNCFSKTLHSRHFCNQIHCPGIAAEGGATKMSHPGIVLVLVAGNPLPRVRHTRVAVQPRC